MELNGKQLIVNGDRILVAPERGESLNKAGLYLPATAVDAKQVHSGRVVEVGPGHLLAHLDKNSEPWKDEAEEPRYIPLQAKVGDVALYLKDQAIEVAFEGKNFVIVPNASLLALVRPSLVQSLES
jgi:co-chaperonin GroES (HSP10)